MNIRALRREGRDQESRPSFVQLERIENGILVHYQKAQSLVTPGSMLGRPGPAPMREFGVIIKTVYCADLKAVQQVVEQAWKSQEWIDKLEKDNKDKMNSSDFA